MLVEPLRKQAEVAKKYLVLRDELRVLEISVWLECFLRMYFIIHHTIEKVFGLNQTPSSFSQFVLKIPIPQHKIKHP